MHLFEGKLFTILCMFHQTTKLSSSLNEENSLTHTSYNSFIVQHHKHCFNMISLHFHKFELGNVRAQVRRLDHYAYLAVNALGYIIMFRKMHCIRPHSRLISTNCQSSPLPRHIRLTIAICTLYPGI